MKTILVDANVVIRFLLNDHETFSPKAKSIFLKAQEGKIKIYLDEVIVAEVIWTLSSFYKIGKTDLVDRMKKIISQDWIVNPRKTALIKAIDLYDSSNLDYIDCWVFAVGKSRGIILETFDKNLNKLRWPPAEFEF